MRLRHIQYLFLLLLLSPALYAQEDNWDVYMAQYEKGTGSTLINMTAKKYAPNSGYPFVLITGITFKNCSPDGLPEKSQFTELYRVSDSIKAAISRKTGNIAVGTFTYQCERLDYYYIKDTAGLRTSLSACYDKYFGKYESYINIKEDASWEAYLDFLYPNTETLEYMSNQQIVIKLQQAGDKLVKPRQVDHWIYFKTEKDRDCYITYVTKNKFKIEAKEKTTDTERPYKLQVSRLDKADLSSITILTLEMRKEAAKCNGDYDGWETFVIK